MKAAEAEKRDKLLKLQNEDSSSLSSQGDNNNREYKLPAKFRLKNPMQKFVNLDKEKLMEHVSVGMPDHSDPFFKHLDKIAVKPKQDQNFGILRCQ